MKNIQIRRLATRSTPFIPGIMAILTAIAIIISPESSFEASLQGLKLWWTLVFPALLPFLMLSEMLTASGFVHGFGVLLEPLMKKVFRLPGASGWTLALGITAGFPGGAGGVMQLHKQNSISDKEAARLAALTHFASPVTMLIVIGIAFLHSTSAGYFLLAIHWISGLLASYTDALLKGRSANTKPVDKISADTKRSSLYSRVQLAATDARAKDGRSFGKLLGESVANAVQSLMVVGGYMIMFAVVINIITTVLPALPAALPASLLEIHLGADAISKGLASIGTGPSSMFGIALLSAALGWSGLCAQLQVLTMLKQARVRFLPYATVRLMHGLYAFLLTLLLWKPLLVIPKAALPALADSRPTPSGTLNVTDIWSSFPQLLSLQALLLIILLGLSAGTYLVSTIRHRLG
ncbi:nucleoside recognition domain-containing protein [Paenibacillus sp. FSL E2-0177]|uniref:nucleoside recognition domain-containing protein n=1 Tax=Paenibacillus sp. FSL E2-0177 TaxID=2921360 RepID=UPI0030EEC0ED